MKRQHPTDPDLFWCPKCRTYKNKDDFFFVRHGVGGTDYVCKKCKRDISKVWRKNNYKKEKERSRKKSLKERSTKDGRIKSNARALKSYYNHVVENREKAIKKVKQWRDKYPEKLKKIRHNYKKRAVYEMRDTYLSSNMKRDGIPITTETIELKRKLITIKRIERSMRNELVG